MKGKKMEGGRESYPKRQSKWAVKLLIGEMFL